MCGVYRRVLQKTHTPRPEGKQSIGHAEQAKNAARLLSSLLWFVLLAHCLAATMAIVTSSDLVSMDSANGHDSVNTHGADIDGKERSSLSSTHAREQCKAAMESISSIHDEVISSRTFNSDPIGKEHEDLPASTSMPASAPETLRGTHMSLQSPPHTLHTAGHVLDDDGKQRVCIHDANASMPLADNSNASTSTAFDSFAAYSSAMFEKANSNAVYETMAATSSPQSYLDSKEEDMHTPAINEAFKAKTVTGNPVVLSSRSEAAFTTNSDPLPLSHSRHIYTSTWPPFDARDAKQGRDLAQPNGSLQRSIKVGICIVCSQKPQLAHIDSALRSISPSSRKEMFV